VASEIIRMLFYVFSLRFLELLHMFSRTLQRTTPEDEPEPDYDGNDSENDTIHVDGLLPRPREIVACELPSMAEPPTPPPLPPPSTFGFSAGLQVIHIHSFILFNNNNNNNNTLICRAP